MTRDEIRLAIAEVRGWVWYRIPSHRNDDRQYRCLCLPAIHEYEGQSPAWLVRADGTERICNMKFMETNGYVPKITLDELHEAEEVLTIQQSVAYEGLLDEIVNRYFKAGQTINIVPVWHATAIQKAEAILKTLGKWPESERKVHQTAPETAPPTAP